jgi:glycosyltransferase involved in cell wall biosynthesis
MTHRSGHRKILQITSYPPPRAGWGMRVYFLKRDLERRGHECVVLNIGQSRSIPSPEYETVLSGMDYLRKVWRYSRTGYVAHVHVNGASPQGFALAIAAEAINLLWGKRCFLTFHAGADQIYFPRPKYPLLLPVFWALFAIPRWVICNSETVKSKIREYGVPARKIVPIQAFSRQYLEYAPAQMEERVESFYRRFRHVVFCYINIRPKFHPVAALDGFRIIADANPDVGLILCGVGGYAEGDLWGQVQQRIRSNGLEDRICVVEDFDHDEFLTALSRSWLSLRTHVSDGVCSSVLEALALGVPVVAAENGQRPPGVLTYTADDPQDLARALEYALAHRATIAATLPKPDIPDTLRQEADLLLELTEAADTIDRNAERGAATR